MPKDRSADAVRHMLGRGRLTGFSDDDIARIEAGAGNAIRAVAATIDFSVFESTPAEFYAVLERLADEYDAE